MLLIKKGVPKTESSESKFPSAEMLNFLDFMRYSFTVARTAFFFKNAAWSSLGMTCMSQSNMAVVVACVQWIKEQEVGETCLLSPPCSQSLKCRRIKSTILRRCQLSSKSASHGIKKVVHLCSRYWLAK